VRKPKQLRGQAVEAEELRARSEEVRIDFADVDLDTAKTFLELARMDFASGESEHASRLLQNAERAAEVVRSVMNQLPERVNPAMRSRLEALNKAIRETKGRAG
jgi:hypothetical protein